MGPDRFWNIRLGQSFFHGESVLLNQLRTRIQQPQSSIWPGKSLFEGLTGELLSIIFGISEQID